MKIKTSELTGAALDWAVAQNMTGGELFQSGRVAYAVVLQSVGGIISPYFVEDSGVVRCEFEPSANWLQGGPIIERELIELRYDRTGRWANAWIASTLERMLGGPTPLIAAMRCYVAAKLGDEVDIPEELLK